jgi:hypothetical protein
MGETLDIEMHGAPRGCAVHAGRWVERNAADLMAEHPAPQDPTARNGQSADGLISEAPTMRFALGKDVRDAVDALTMATPTMETSYRRRAPTSSPAGQRLHG